MTDRYENIRRALEGLRERCAQEAERITGRRRVVASMINNQAVKPCEVAAASMSLRDAMAMSVRLPDVYSAEWGEALIGEKQPPSDAEPSVHIDWWMRVEAAYRYRMADAMLKAREVRNG